MPFSNNTYQTRILSLQPVPLFPFTDFYESSIIPKNKPNSTETLAACTPIKFGVRFAHSLKKHKHFSLRLMLELNSISLEHSTHYHKSGLKHESESPLY
jgi:hypothetical protein